MPEVNGNAIDHDNNPSPVPDGGTDGRKYDGAAGGHVRPSDTQEEEGRQHYVNGEMVSAEEAKKAESSPTQGRTASPRARSAAARSRSASRPRPAARAAKKAAAKDGGSDGRKTDGKAAAPATSASTPAA